jgi:1-acyl-sn-glycerol-3-phosphate acyltransferase
MYVVRKGAVDVTVVWGGPLRVSPGDDRKALARRLERSVREMAAEARAGRALPAAPAESDSEPEAAILKAAKNG